MVEDYLECLEVTNIEQLHVEGADPEESIFAVLPVQLPQSLDGVFGSTSESNSKHPNPISQRQLPGQQEVEVAEEREGGSRGGQ